MITCWHQVLKKIWLSHLMWNINHWFIVIKMNPLPKLDWYLEIPTVLQKYWFSQQQQVSIWQQHGVLIGCQNHKCVQFLFIKVSSAPCQPVVVCFVDHKTHRAGSVWQWKCCAGTFHRDLELDNMLFEGLPPDVRHILLNLWMVTHQANFHNPADLCDVSTAE